MEIQRSSKLSMVAAILSLGMGSQAMASLNSVTQLPAEGNVQCNDYSSNTVIEEMDTSNPVGDQPTLTGPENLADPDNPGGESVTYTMSADGATITSFDSSTPIDYAVLKSGRDVTVLMYESGGVTADEDLSLIQGGEISAFALCYGLSNEPPPPPEPLPPQEFHVCGGLDGVGITCPVTSPDDPSFAPPSLVCNFELEDAAGEHVPFFGLDDGENCCVCNAPEVTECNADLPAEAIVEEGELLPCPDRLVDNLEVNSVLDLTPDDSSFICITTGGTRRCYRR